MKTTKKRHSSVTHAQPSQPPFNLFKKLKKNFKKN